MKSIKQLIEEDKRDFNTKELIIMWCLFTLISLPSVFIGLFVLEPQNGIYFAVFGLWLAMTIFYYQVEKLKKRITELTK